MLQNNDFLKSLFILVTMSGLLLAGCNSLSDTGQQKSLTLQFQTSGSSASGSSIAPAAAGQQTGDTLGVEGTNGRLEIDDIRFIVEDFELEKSEGECGDAAEGEEEDDCEELEAGPFFVDLPLQGDILNLASSLFDPGLYEELEFEIDDLDLDEEEEDDLQEKQDLINQVRAEFPDWPDEVSMLISGNFISANDDTTSFKVFAEAEIEIEMEFNPPMEINENSLNKIVRVKINPKKWLLQPDGTVLNLAEYDYETTGRILEFELEFENGFESVEVDDDNDDDDDDS